MERPTWLEASEGAVDQTLRAEEPRLATLAREAQLWFPCCMYLLDRDIAVDYPQPVLECAPVAFESLTLATHAYYRSAISALRLQMELAVLSIVFKTDESTRRKHMKGERIRSFRELAHQVFELSEFRDYANAMRAAGLNDLASQVDLQSVHDTFWSNPLSRITHGALAMWNMTSWDYGPTPQYSAQDFDIWGDLYEATQHMSLLWVLLAHHGMFRSIEQRNPQEWSVLFDPVETTYLEKVH